MTSHSAASGDSARGHADPGASAAAGFSHADILRVIVGLMPCLLLAAIDQMVVIPALPQIAAAMGDLDSVSWVVTAYLLTSVAATPVWGKMSDLHGRRPVLLACLSLFVLASIACALSQSMGALIAARAFQGLGGAGLMGIAQSAVADVVSPRERGRYQIYMVSMWATASIAGPVVGGYVTEHLSWRWIFWINIPVGLVALASCFHALKIIVVAPRRRLIDWPGCLLIFAATTCVLLGFHRLGEASAAALREAAALGVAGAILIVVLLRHEARHAEPILPPRLLGVASFRSGVSVAALNSFGLFAATFMLPIYYALVAGAGAGRSGLLIMPMLAFNAIAAFTGGQITRRTGRTRGVIATGLAMGALGFAMLTQLGPQSAMTQLLVAMMLIGAGSGAAMPTVLILVQNASDARDIGSATGMIMLTRAIGGALGVAVCSAIMAGHGAIAGRADQMGSGADHLLPALRMSFGVCCAVLAAAAIVAARMREAPLRATSSKSPVRS